MKEPLQSAFDPVGDPALPLCRFAHEAMATTFEIMIAGQDATYAGQAARTAFRELDRLEEELSRFIPSSDIARIQALEAGQAIRISPETWDCLQLAQRIHAQTQGAFDVTIGPLLAWWQAHPATPEEIESGAHEDDEGFRAALERVGMDKLVLSEAEPAVGVLVDHMIVDLGAIGKGFAVDQMAAILREWGIEQAILHGGQSSVLVLGTPPGEAGWPMGMRNPENQSETFRHVRLRDCSLSGSGLFLHGRHIIDPRSGYPMASRLGTWAIAPTAAESDAISTAFMVMAPSEVEAYCQRYPEVSAMLMAGEPGHPDLRSFGLWDEPA